MKALWIILLTMMVIAGCTSKANEEKPVSNSITEKTTHCFGHSVMELPSDFYLMDGSSGSFLPSESSKTSDRIDVTLLAANSSEKAFAQNILARRSGILEATDEKTNRLNADRKSHRLPICSPLM